MRSRIIIAAAALLAAFPLPAFAAEGLSGATVRADSAQQSPERKAMRERCQADPEKCRAEMKAMREKRAEQCKADPEKCRAEMQARRKKWCADNPDKCREMKAHMEQCKADPEKCRREMQERQEERFKRADADGNGMLSRAEVNKGMPGLARHFDQIDTNKDGQLSREELDAARKARAVTRKNKPS